jgi:hypothetical protein
VEKDGRFQRRLAGADDADVLAGESRIAVVLGGMRSEVGRELRQGGRDPLEVTQPHRHYDPARLQALPGGKADAEHPVRSLDERNLYRLHLRNEPALKPQAVFGERFHAAGFAVLEPALPAPLVEGEPLRIVDGGGKSQRLEEHRARHVPPEAHRLSEDAERDLAAP